MKMFRAVLHGLLIALFTLKLLFWNYTKARYIRSVDEGLAFAFSTPFEEIQRLQRFQLFNINETILFLDQIVWNYNNIQNVSVAEFQYGRLVNSGRDCFSSPQALTLYTYHWTASYSVVENLYEITDYKDLDFVRSNPVSFFETLDSLRFSLSLCNFPHSYVYMDENQCNYWNTDIVYRMISSLYVEVSIQSNLEDSCTATDKQTVNRFSVWCDIWLFVLSLLYSRFICLDILDARRVLQSVKAAHEKARLEYLSQLETLDSSAAGPVEVALLYSWKDIPWATKRSFLNYWSWLTLAAVALLIIQGAVSLSDPYDDWDSLLNYQKGFQGLACLLLWTTILQFIPPKSQVYGIASTIQMAFPRLVAFLASFLPVYCFFLFVGIALFGQKFSFFASFESSSRFIFTFLSGDSVKQIFQLLSTRSVFAAIIFGVFLMLLTAYLLINILIAIVEEAYFIARKQGRYLEQIMWQSLKSLLVGNNQQQQHGAAASDESDPNHNPLSMQDADKASPAPTPDHIPARFDRSMDITITLAEEAAEVYIFGHNHWEYSKMMDHIVEHLGKET